VFVYLCDVRKIFLNPDVKEAGHYGK
jgi:hypothetical protein